jgi:DNA (cytosine-5)-methyltransferase 1
MSRPRLMDWFSGAGGAAVGYHRAGFEVVGVDIEPQPNYPFEFHHGDALKFSLDGFDAVHASPPCQAYTAAQRLQGNEHPDLVARTRALLERSGLPYVLENVPGSPLRSPVTLCGTMFGLGTLRHRLFETSFRLLQPEHPAHLVPQVKMGRAPAVTDYIQVVGNFSGIEQGRAAMGIHWMTRGELAQAIPPAYTEFIGRQLLRELA